MASFVANLVDPVFQELRCIRELRLLYRQRKDALRTALRLVMYATVGWEALKVLRGALRIAGFLTPIALFYPPLASHLLRCGRSEGGWMMRSLRR